MIVFAALAGVVALLVFALARRFELEGRPDRWVAIVLVVMILESFVYPAQPTVPAGPFRVPLLGGGVRTHDLLVVVGLAARATVRPLPRRLRADGVLWFLAGVWFATAAVRGLLGGNPTSIVLFSGGSVVGLFGGYLLVAGCDPRRLADFFRARYLIPIGALVLLMAPNQLADDPAEFFGTGLGTISVDTASVFIALATFGVLIEWSRRPRSSLAVWLCIPLVLTPFTIEQRATLLQLGAVLLVVVWAVLHSEWNDRIHVTRVKLLWGSMLLLGGMMAILMISLSGSDSTVPLAEYYEDTFEAEGQQLSAQARQESFAVGVEEFLERPLFGDGLGHTYRITRPGSDFAVEPATYDNVVVDVATRAGIVGFVLFWSANAASVVAGWRAWRRSSDPAVAALALAAVAVLVGLVVKSGFESILEKGKLALIWGMTAGAIAAAARWVDQPSSPQQGDARPSFEGSSRWT